MMSKTVWDEIWNNDGYSKQDLREEKAKRKLNLLYAHINILPNHTVVDLGCGGGYISKQLYHDKKCNVIGVDSSQKAINIAKRVCFDLPIQFIHSNASSLHLDDNIADFVLCIGVFEHIQDFDNAVISVMRVLKPGGTICIFSSNKNSCMYYHRRLKELVGLWKYGYQKNWTSNNMKNTFESFGFKTTHLQIVGGIRDFPILTLIDNILTFIFKKWGRYILYVGSIEK